MADVKLRVGHIEGGNEVAVMVAGLRPPYQKNICEIVEIYKVGEDFVSGDNIQFQFQSVTKVFIQATNDVGDGLTYVESNVVLDGKYSAIQIQFNNVTTDLKIFAITDL